MTSHLTHSHQFEVIIETKRTKRHLYCRSRQGGHIRTLRRESHRHAVPGDLYGIQELFERVETVGIQLGNRYVGIASRGPHQSTFRRRFFSTHRAACQARKWFLSAQTDQTNIHTRVRALVRVSNKCARRGAMCESFVRAKANTRARE